MDELRVLVAVDGDDHHQVGDEYGDGEQRHERALGDARHGDAEHEPVAVDPRVPAAAVVQERSRQHRRPAGPHRLTWSAPGTHRRAGQNESSGAAVLLSI